MHLFLSSARVGFFWQLQPFSPSFPIFFFASHSTSEHLRRRLFCFLFFFFFLFCYFLFFFLFFSFWMVWLVLLCSRTRYTLALHLLYLDELRLFGLLCFTVGL